MLAAGGFLTLALVMTRLGEKPPSTHAGMLRQPHVTAPLGDCVMHPRGAIVISSKVHVTHSLCHLKARSTSRPSLQPVTLISGLSREGKGRFRRHCPGRLGPQDASCVSQPSSLGLTSDSTVKKKAAPGGGQSPREEDGPRPGACPTGNGGQAERTARLAEHRAACSASWAPTRPRPQRPGGLRLLKALLFNPFFPAVTRPPSCFPFLVSFSFLFF